MPHTLTSHKSLISIFEACNARISRALVGTLYYPICNKNQSYYPKICIMPVHHEMNGNKKYFENIPPHRIFTQYIIMHSKMTKSRPGSNIAYR